MGCGTSSPKPVKTNTQTNKNLPTSGAAPTNNQTNGKAGPNQGETSNSQIDVQIEPNSSQNNGNLPSKTSEGVHGSAENGADTLESKDKNGGTDGNGTQQKNDTNTKTSSGKKIAARPNNQNVKAPNLQRYDNNVASGNTIQRNTPTNSTRTRVSRPAGRSTPGYASPRNHTYPRYPIANTDGRFQHSRARSVPPKNQQQRLSDELANDPAFRKKLLIESNERLKAQEIQPKTGGGDNKSNTRLKPQENRSKQSGRDNSSDRSMANNNQYMKGGKDNNSSDKLKAPGNKSKKGGGNNKTLQDKRDTQNMSNNGKRADRSPQKTNWEENQDDAIDQTEKSDDVSSQSPRDSSKDEVNNIFETTDKNDIEMPDIQDNYVQLRSKSFYLKQTETDDDVKGKEITCSERSLSHSGSVSVLCESGDEKDDRISVTESNEDTREKVSEHVTPVESSVKIVVTDLTRNSPMSAVFEGGTPINDRFELSEGQGMEDNGLMPSFFIEKELTRERLKGSDDKVDVQKECSSSLVDSEQDHWDTEFSVNQGEFTNGDIITKRQKQPLDNEIVSKQFRCNSSKGSELEHQDGIHKQSALDSQVRSQQNLNENATALVSRMEETPMAKNQEDVEQNLTERVSQDIDPNESILNTSDLENADGTSTGKLTHGETQQQTVSGVNSQDDAEDSSSNKEFQEHPDNDLENVSNNPDFLRTKTIGDAYIVSSEKTNERLNESTKESRLKSDDSVTGTIDNTNKSYGGDEESLKATQVETMIELSPSPEVSETTTTPRTKQRRIVHPPLPRYEDPHERARARRIRFMLRQAMLSNNLDELDEAIWQFETNNMVDLGDLTEAIKRLEILQLKKDLKQAIGRRNLGILNTAIDDTYNTHHEQALRGLLDRAEELRDHLQALNHYSHDIMQMDHNVISEIRSYCNPPPSIHEVMAACYMLLGIKEEKLLDWPDVQGYLGRVGQFGLKNMIMNFDPDRVPLHTVLRVKEILNFYSLEDVRAASNGAACFYIWAKNMVDIIDNRRNQDEDGDRAKSSTKKG